MTELSIEIKAALIGAIISALVGGVVAFGVTNYFSDQQMSLDRQGTAKQLSIEFDNLDYQLDFFSQAYIQNLDLAKTGAYWPEDIIQPNPDVPTLLIVDDSEGTATAPYVIRMYKGGYESTKLNNEGLARLRFPIKGMKMPAVLPIQLADPNNSIYCTLSYPIMPARLYNEHGVYYEYGTRLGGFNKNLSESLYLFYYLLSEAESDRQYVQNYIDSHPGENLNRQYFNAYMEMRDDIVRASRMTKSILIELQNEMNN